MSKYSKERAKQLGMSVGSARNKLHKSILFKLICDTNQNKCYQCGEIIESVDDLSIEHKEPWLHKDNAIDLYFDLNNIAFSHLSCNVSAAKRRLASCGTISAYIRGCRCEECKKIKSEYASSKYCSEQRHERYIRLGS